MIRREQNNSRYIVDLLKRVVRVSHEIMRVIKKLPLISEISP